MRKLIALVLMLVSFSVTAQQVVSGHRSSGGSVNGWTPVELLIGYSQDGNYIDVDPHILFEIRNDSIAREGTMLTALVRATTQVTGGKVESYKAKILISSCRGDTAVFYMTNLNDSSRSIKQTVYFGGGSYGPRYSRIAESLCSALTHYPGPPQR